VLFSIPLLTIIKGKVPGFFLFGIVCLSLLFPTLLFSQTVETHQALLQLDDMAQTSLAQEDFEGAALTMGKAALQASLLAQESQEARLVFMYHTHQHIFRAREQMYRALALHQQSGETIPAGSAVCVTLTLGKKELFQARQQTKSETHLGDFSKFHELEIQEWKQWLEELQVDLQCRD
jgi:hypothetical protein